MSEVITPIFGSNQSDSLVGSRRSEVFSGRQGDDMVQANSGSDQVYGGSGDDTLSGDSGNDILYGGGGPSYVDMSAFTITEDYVGSVTFLGEGAGYRNALGMYKVDDDGSIYDVDILFPNASKVGSGGSLVPGESSVEVALEAGDQIGFFIVSNGYGKGGSNQSMLSDLEGSFELRNLAGEPGNLLNDRELQLFHIDAESGEATGVRSQYGYDIYHSAAFPEADYEPNPDNFPHTVGKVNSVSGEVFLGFEDLRGGGDKDYDDTVFSFDVGVSNAQVLDPNLAYTEGDDDGVPDGSGDGTAEAPMEVSENDYLIGGNGQDQIFGMAGHDRAEGGDGSDRLWGNSGLDTLSGGAGDDDISGGKDADLLYGNSGNDALDGNSGDDVLFGEAGDDILSGSSGADFLSGGDGQDSLSGGSGDDELSGDIGNDSLSGGSGHDSLSGGDGTDRLDGGKGDDDLFGGDGADKLWGGSGTDDLFGEDGKDYMNGGSGDDRLEGGAGNDRLLGEKGSDVLVGGLGNDRFVFRASDADGSQDIISDFEIGDLIELRGFGFGNLDDLQAAAQQEDGGVAIQLTAGDSLTIEGTSLSDLESDWFLFA